MNTIQLKIISTSFVFLFIFLSGFWLSRNGSPYGTGFLTVHKLISLARVMTGWMPGGLGHVNVAVPMLFAGISGSSTADAAGCGLQAPYRRRQQGVACRRCCNQFHGGRWNARFQLVFEPTAA